MSTRYFKHGDGRKWIDIEGVGFLEFDVGRWCFYGMGARFFGCTHSLSTTGLIECDANWQPLPSNKPLDPPLAKVREWVRGNERWLWDGKEMFHSDGRGGIRRTKETPSSLVLGLQWSGMYWSEVHPGTRIPIDQPLPSPPGDVVPANKAKPAAEKTELDRSIEWLESPEQQAAKLSFACSMVTNGLREVNRRIDNIERRLAIKG